RPHMRTHVVDGVHLPALAEDGDQLVGNTDRLRLALGYVADPADRMKFSHSLSNNEIRNPIALSIVARGSRLEQGASASAEAEAGQRCRSPSSLFPRSGGEERQYSTVWPCYNS